MIIMDLRSLLKQYELNGSEWSGKGEKASI